MRILLHIGTHKTGTTSIQRSLQAQAARLRQQGVWYPPAGDAQHWRLAYDLRAGNRRPLLAALAEARQQGCDTLLLSSEAFLEQAPFGLARELAFLRQEADEVNIILYLRRQDLYWESLYREAVKNGRTRLPFRAFIDLDRLLAAADQVEQVAGSAIPVLAATPRLPVISISGQDGYSGQAIGECRFGDWLALVRSWAAAFGRENLVVRPFAPGHFAGGSLISDFLMACRIDPDAGPNDLRLQVGYGDGVVEFARRLGPLRGDADFGRFHHLLKAAVASGRLEAWNQRHSGWLAPAERALLLERFAESNRQVAQEYGGQADGVLFRDLPAVSAAWLPPPDESIAQAQLFAAEFQPHLPGCGGSLALWDAAASVDADWYLASYPDVAGHDPHRHFRLHGRQEGRLPHNPFVAPPPPAIVHPGKPLPVQPIPGLAGTVILYHPDAELPRRLASYLPHLARLYVVDNSEIPDESLLARLGRLDPRLRLIVNSDNLGIATALNQAARAARADGFSWLLTMDQDSAFLDGVLFERLAAVFAGGRMAVVAPAAVVADEPAGELHPDGTEEALLVMTSGSVVNLAAWAELGGFREPLFIAEVDYEFCLRARQAGWRLCRLPQARLEHQLGTPGVTVSRGRQRPLVVQPPRRHYYVVRNLLQVASDYEGAFPQLCRQRRHQLWTSLRQVALHENQKLRKLGYAALGWWHFRTGRAGRCPEVVPSVWLARGALRLSKRIIPAGVRRQLRAWQKRLLDRERPCRTVHFTSPLSGDLVPGVTVVGYLRAATGLGEAARSDARALAAAQVDFSLVDFCIDDMVVANDDSWNHKLTRRFSYQANLMHFNPDMMLRFRQQFPEPLFRGRYNIGCWIWELPVIPDAWRECLADFDEIWTGSEFSRQAIAAVTTVPVLTMPSSVAPEPDPALGRPAFGLPDGKFLFLVMYDVMSAQDRKNPQGAIAAFREAFGAGDAGVGLIIKINHAASDPAEVAQLRQLVSGLSQAYVLDQPMSRREVISLISLCDAVVSLHRSEGFGLVLAEAMALGRPVIGTNWSGNIDFMRPGNSCLVDARLVPVRSRHPLYLYADQCWADPDVGQAASWMRRLREEPALAAEIGRQGRETMRQEFSPAVVGALMRRRLEAIGVV
jgi:glycosyltransferase involved in cell wall biosynthesis